MVCVLLLVCCTTTTYQAEIAQQPPAEAPTIVVGAITAKDEEVWHGYAVLVRRGLIEQLAKLRGADRVAALAPGSTPPAEAPVITGELTEFDKGDVALRWIIGFGAGRAHAVSRFQVADATGTILMRFTTTKEYAGGAGIGGADLLDADTLARQLGEKAAEAIENWVKTGRLP
jgi:hypothetical protein